MSLCFMLTYHSCLSMMQVCVVTCVYEMGELNGGCSMGAIVSTLERKESGTNACLEADRSLLPMRLPVTATALELGLNPSSTPTCISGTRKLKDFLTGGVKPRTGGF